LAKAKVLDFGHCPAQKFWS